MEYILQFLKLEPNFVIKNANFGYMLNTRVKLAPQN